MPAAAFDTLACAQRLIAAGVPHQQANVQAQIMADAFLANADVFVTKDSLEASLDARFAAQDARIEARFVSQDARLDARFAEMEMRFGKIDGQLKLIYWMLALIMTSTVVPTLVNFFA